jgi:hypothetical protein
LGGNVYVTRDGHHQGIAFVLEDWCKHLNGEPLYLKASYGLLCRWSLEDRTSFWFLQGRTARWNSLYDVKQGLAMLSHIVDSCLAIE